MVSPNWTVTAPSACLASFPVSIMICLSPTGAVALSDIVCYPPLPPRNFSESRKRSGLNEISQGQRSFLLRECLRMVAGPFAFAGQGKSRTLQASLSAWNFGRTGSAANLFAQLEFFGNCLVAVDVRRMQIVQKPATLADHHEQPAAGAM